MKLHPTKQPSAAFSLIEFSLVSAITVFMLAGVVYTHIMGQNLHRWSMSKVGSNDHSREALARLQGEIRAAKSVEIGYYTNGSFHLPRLGKPQVGQTIRVFPSTNANLYVQYRLWPINNNYVLKRAERFRNGSFEIRTVGTHLTNNPAMFALEDFRGNHLTEPSANAIVAVTLDFRQYQYPITKVGRDYYHDYYRVQTRIAKRMVE